MKELLVMHQKENEERLRVLEKQLAMHQQY
jgi:hypothetical protein